MRFLVTIATVLMVGCYLSHQLPEETDSGEPGSSLADSSFPDAPTIDAAPRPDAETVVCAEDPTSTVLALQSLLPLGFDRPVEPNIRGRILEIEEHGLLIETDEEETVRFNWVGHPLADCFYQDDAVALEVRDGWHKVEGHRFTAFARVFDTDAPPQATSLASASAGGTPIEFTFLPSCRSEVVGPNCSSSGRLHDLFVQTWSFSGTMEAGVDTQISNDWVSIYHAGAAEILAARGESCPVEPGFRSVVTVVSLFECIC